MMHKKYLSRSQSKFWSAEIPVGDPFGGVAYGEYNDPATAIVGGAVISGVMGANAAQGAASTQAAASDRATQAQLQMYNQTQANLKPYMGQGSTALSTLATNANNGFTGADYLNNQDPGYQFQLDQGQQSLQNSQAAGDGIMSGSALKGLINYNQNAASTGYQSAYNRWLSTQGLLSNVASIGESAAAGAGSSGASFANGISNSITGAGNAGAAGIMGASNAITGSIGTVGNMYALNGLSGGKIFGNSDPNTYSLPAGNPYGVQ